jgi:hypothetical protein
MTVCGRYDNPITAEAYRPLFGTELGYGMSIGVDAEHAPEL